MPKVKCLDCRHFTKSSKGYTPKSYGFIRRTRPKGWCDNDEQLEETSGYTGMASGHKGSRLGDTLRWCKFFESLTLVQQQEKEAEFQEKWRKHKEWLDKLPVCIMCGAQGNGCVMVGHEHNGPFCSECYDSNDFDYLRTYKPDS